MTAAGTPPRTRTTPMPTPDPRHDPRMNKAGTGVWQPGGAGAHDPDDEFGGTLMGNLLPDEDELDGTLMGNLLPEEEDEIVGEVVPASPPPPRLAPPPPTADPPPPPAPQPRSTPPPPAARQAEPFRPTARPPVATLTVFDDGQTEGEVVRVRGDRFRIGREEGEWLVPHDPQVAPVHAEVVRARAGDGYEWVLRDLSAADPGGMFVRVSRTLLTPGSVVQIGRTVYRLIGPDPDRTEPGGSAPPEAADPLRLVDAATGETVLTLPASPGGEYWVGHDPRCDVRPAGDPFIEARHARIFADPKGRWVVQHNKTLNGLWVRVREVAVRDMCTFQLGEQRFRLKCDPRAGG